MQERRQPYGKVRARPKAPAGTEPSFRILKKDLRREEKLTLTSFGKSLELLPMTSLESFKLITLSDTYRNY